MSSATQDTVRIRHDGMHITAYVEVTRAGRPSLHDPGESAVVAIVEVLAEDDEGEPHEVAIDDELREAIEAAALEAM